MRTMGSTQSITAVSLLLRPHKWWLRLPVPQFCYPMASAIDTPLPKPQSRNHIMLNYAPDWVHVPTDGAHYAEYPERSLEQWHKDNSCFVE